jgi:hypothetical protein
MSKDPLANKVESFELTSKDDNGRQLALGLSLSGLILTDSDPSSIQLAPAAPAPAENTNLAVNAESDPFQIIGRNNIFDQSRRFQESGPRRAAPKVETITFHGAAMNDGLGSAWFEGSGVGDSREYKTGDSLGGDLKIAKINNVDTVTLTNASSNTFVLSLTGNSSLRREENGPWRLSGYIAAVASSETNSTESASSTPSNGNGNSDIVALLKKRRQEAEK